MKKNFLQCFFPALMLGFMTCGIVACGDDDDDGKPGTEQPGDDGKDDGKDDDNPDAPQQEKIVVTVDANGNANDGHRFIVIDASNFMIDDIKYTAKSGDLWVTGYDEAYFKGEAKLIDALDYQGHHLEVKGIDDNAFNNCKVLTSITIPGSVTSIGNKAFDYCTGLTAVFIQDLKAWCKITFGSNPLWLAHHLYLNGKEVTDLVIPNGITSIEGAFMGCKNLASVTIPSSLTSIGDYTFYDCTGLTAVYISDLEAWCKITFGLNPLVFAHHLYLNGKEVTDLVIPSITNFGVAFSGCTSLTTVTIPESVTSIVNEAFYGCTGLKTITIPESVTSIGDLAFNYCTSLASVTIPESVTSLGRMAFRGCEGLTSVTIPGRVASIGGSAFFGCTNLTSVTILDGVTSIGDSAFKGCTGLTSVTIPESVTSIENQAFSGCTSLKSFTIPEGVKFIGSEAFRGCENIKTVTINSNTILSKEFSYGKGLISIFGNQVEEYILGGKITSIGSYSFAGCSSLTSLTIPESVTSIGSNAFSGCTGLNSFTIPESVSSIGSNAFSGCTGLTSFTIPERVTSIGYGILSSCEGLKSITVAKGNTSYSSPNNCNAIIETSSNKLIAGCMSTIIPNSVTTIGRDAFSGCSGLTSVNIPDGVTSLGDTAFHGCIGLTSVIIPNGVTSIGYGTFMGCTALKLVSIPKSVTSISNFAFSSCTALKEFYSYAVTPPSTNESFEETPISSATLHVPAGSIDVYNSKSPWSGFGSIVAIEQ